MQNKNIIVSIIVPVYNVEQYLSKAIDSILNQSFPNFELILVDDGSTDNSGIICDKYQAMDNRIKVFHKKNEGVSIARNFGVNMACGKYVCFLDSDDWFENNAIEVLVDLVENHGADIGMIPIQETKEETTVYEKNEDSFSYSSSECFSMILKEFLLFVSINNKIYPKKLLKDIQLPENLAVGEDYYVAIDRFSKINNLILSNKSCMYYRINPYSVTHNGFKRKTLDHLIAMEHVNDTFLKLSKHDLYIKHANKTLACYIDYAIKLNDSNLSDKHLLINDLKKRAKNLIKTLPFYHWKLYIIKRYLLFIISLKLYRKLFFKK